MHDCNFIEVTQGFRESINNLYVRTDDWASTPTKNSTWKHPNATTKIYTVESPISKRLNSKQSLISKHFW